MVEVMEPVKDSKYLKKTKARALNALKNFQKKFKHIKILVRAAEKPITLQRMDERRHYSQLEA